MSDCSPEQVSFIRGKCEPYENEVTDLIVFGGSEIEDANNVPSICHRVTDCFGAINCGWARIKKRIYDEYCGNATFQQYNVTDCISNFYVNVYHGANNCSKDFDFFSKDMLSRRVAYTNGKSCFLEIIKDNCSEPAISYLNSNYAIFLKFMTTSSVDGACASLHDELMGKQCDPLTRIFTEELKLWLRDRILHIKRDSNIAKMCRDVEECMSNYCYFDNYQESFAEICEEVNEPIENPKTYGDCYMRIASKLNYSKYNCIKEKQMDMDLNPFTLVTEKFKPFLKDKECVKTVMEGECEPLALENFDVEWEKMRKIKMELESE